MILHKIFSVRIKYPIYYSIKGERKAIDYGEIPILIPSKRRKEKRKRRIFPLLFVFLCIILVVIGVFYVININYTITGAEFFCFCAQTAKDEQTAQQYSEEVRNKGGAGYIFSENNEYYIIASIYFDRETAEKIAEKNGGTVLKRNLPTLTFSSKKLLNAVKDEYKKIGFYLKSLIKISYNYDNKRESLEGLQSELNFYEQALQSKSLSIFNKLSICPEQYLESVKIKYYACELAFVACEYFC